MDDNSSESGEAQEEEDLNELRFSRAQSYFDKSLTIRLLIGGFFALCLFFFLHFRETYIDKLELSSEAGRYVVAQIDFAFPDEEATIILKQEAAHEIGTVYRIKDQQIHEKATDFQKFITRDETGMKRWEELSKESGFEDVALALSLIADGLGQTRFTDVKTIQQIEELPEEELPLPRHDFYPYIPPDLSGRLPLPFWSRFSKRRFTDADIPPSVSKFILNYFEPVRWEFEVDQGVEYTLRKLAQKGIPEKYTRVRAGDRLIDQGEKVTSRHIAMLQAMKEGLDQKRNLLDPFTIGGTLLMTLLLVGVAGIYLAENHREIFHSNRKLALLATILILSLLLAKGVELFLIQTTSPILDLVRFPLFVPFSALLLTSLMSVRISAFASVFLSIVYVMALAVDCTPFLVLNLLTAMTVILMARRIRRRKEVFIVCAKAWLASVLVILSFNLYENTTLTLNFIGDLTSTFFFMGMTAILVVGLLPILESTFQIMTDITLMEFMDPSNELLRRLTIEAPGTYQHSMVVGHLSEAAASAIGANGLFCRVSTQYHDIGKLANPQYFTENQLGGMDMHQLLTPLESTQVIIAHVSEGVALARKVGLPEQFIDIIKEHHGTTLVYYFYHKQIELMEGDKSKVDENDFRYSGPKPRTKESTIIMIADTLEAASRCLDLFNEETVTDLVETLIAQKMEDGQFDESLLTFEELGIVKTTLVKTLLAASHPRVKYPTHHPGEEG
ncbi:MAG: HDIG domain-containing protein [Chlamydiales bacterium]|nr:HDIG domain-containing protein [Chlamydiales bacterium]